MDHVWQTHSTKAIYPHMLILYSLWRHLASICACVCGCVHACVRVCVFVKVRKWEVRAKSPSPSPKELACIHLVLYNPRVHSVFSLNTCFIMMDSFQIQAAATFSLLIFTTVGRSEKKFWPLEKNVFWDAISWNFEPCSRALQWMLFIRDKSSFNPCRKSFWCSEDAQHRTTYYMFVALQPQIKRGNMT